MDSMRGQIPGDSTRRHFLRGLGLMGAGSLVAPYAIAQAPPKPTGPAAPPPELPQDATSGSVQQRESSRATPRPDSDRMQGNLMRRIRAQSLLPVDTIHADSSAASFSGFEIGSCIRHRGENKFGRNFDRCSPVSTRCARATVNFPPESRSDCL